MKKAFTLIELLVVIAIIAILAAMLMPALGRAREEAQKSRCRGNDHNIGIALTMFVSDANMYPGWVSDAGIQQQEINNGSTNYWTPGTDGNTFFYNNLSDEVRYQPYWTNNKDKAKYVKPTGGDPFYQIVSKRYMDEAAVFNCPSAEDCVWGVWNGPEFVTAADESYTWEQDAGLRTQGFYEDKVLAFAEYGYDCGRIAKDSPGGRVIAGDGPWRCFPNAEIYEVRENHAGGANAIYADGAVGWIATSEVGTLWSAEPGYLNVTWDSRDVRRSGYLQNPRLDEDVHKLNQIRALGTVNWGEDCSEWEKEEMMPPKDWDDIYVTEGLSWWGTAQPREHTTTLYNSDFPYDGSGPWANWCPSTSTRWGAQTGWAGENVRFVDGTDPYTGLSAALTYEPNAGGAAARTWFMWDNGSTARFYPEAGPFATEPRWSAYDAALKPGGYLRFPAGW